MSQQNTDEINALIAKKRAEVLSRIASLNLPSGTAASSAGNGRSAATSTATPGTPRNMGLAPGAAGTARPATLQPAQKQLNGSSIQDTIAATRARIEARLKAQGIVGQAESKPATAPAPAPQKHTTELHPMLQDDYKASGNRFKRARLGAAPRISSVKANQPKEPEQLKVEHEVPSSFTDTSKNPYFDPTLGNRRTAGPQTRRHAKQFNFVQPGKIVALAEKRRTEARLEQLKEEIAERARKAKLEEEVLDATALQLPEPPEVEWWDAPFLVESEYRLDEENLKIEGPDSLVTLYVQHPVPIEPPAPIRNMGEAPSQLILTRQERKKIRRQRRQEEQRERREKTMLGLLPPEEPKLRMSNFMRIMANQSVPDPTRLEAEVRRQVNARLAKHEADNQARKLTKEQRHEKEMAKLEASEQRGLVSAVFRITKLSHPQHRYKVAINASQMHLTGTALSGPQQTLVIVEGSAQNIKAYKKLMLRRIDWAASLPGMDVRASEKDQMQTDEEIDYSDNACHLIWQGDITERRFSQFKQRTCPTESQAKRWLAGAGCEPFWQLAKQYDPNDSITALDPFA
ncbi:U4/U5/U6 small nuclear ribonucleoprotein prp3 [Coemansia guatemalensis]|uniref:U4/U5/U6 small nuclear ribonucleoprotein prp3 n=1 Tax=Coemansia guatemalensis TaxID=2761395 RepID=A0A9W8HXU4_9FUNG|nr:U4/U5/U6 small nuclear ribonucleoprotein prp3 [Coemansia guatemalensis]